MAADGVAASSSDLRLETGHDAGRPPGHRHGPFKTDGGCAGLEDLFLNRAVARNGVYSGACNLPL